MKENKEMNNGALMACPNQGRCGANRHQVGSHAYNDCLKASTGSTESFSGSAGRFTPIAPTPSGYTEDGWPVVGSMSVSTFDSSILGLNTDTMVNGTVNVQRLEGETTVVSTSVYLPLPDGMEEELDRYSVMPSLQRNLALGMIGKEALGYEQGRLNPESLGEDPAAAQYTPLSWVPGNDDNGTSGHFAVNSIVYPESSDLGNMHDYLAEDFAAHVDSFYQNFVQRDRRAYKPVEHDLFMARFILSHATDEVLALCLQDANYDNEDLGGATIENFAPESRKEIEDVILQCFAGIDTEALAHEHRTGEPRYLADQVSTFLTGVTGRYGYNQEAADRFDKLGFGDRSIIRGDDGLLYFE